MHVLPAQPLPFGLEPIAFPFPALAALAGRLPLGGGREVALAALTCARLASSASGSDALAPPDRAARAVAAKVWLASVALPTPIRVLFGRCIDATSGSSSSIASSLRALAASATTYLDGASIEELERLARQLSSQS